MNFFIIFLSLLRAHCIITLHYKYLLLNFEDKGERPCKESLKDESTGHVNPDIDLISCIPYQFLSVQKLATPGRACGVHKISFVVITFLTH